MPAGKEDRLLERLPVLADTLLLDETWWERYPKWREQGKDSMVDSAVPYLNALRDLREALTHLFETSGNNSLKTRSELAQAAKTESWQPARVTIVDEAQDLAPAEWRTLLASVLRSRRDTHVVLLGDMRQRVSFVPFSWADVKSHATSACDITSSEVVEMDVDNASYRMSRAVAQAALSPFDKRVCGPDGSRRQGAPMDPTQLTAGGRVRVAVVEEAGAQLFESEVRAWARRSGSEPAEHLFCVHGREDGTKFKGLPRLFNHSIKEAKGLESPSVVVNLPFGLRRDERNASIDHDDATEFYTAVSRAREKLLLIIDRASWNLLSRAQECWRDATVCVGAQVTDVWLRDAIVDTSVGLSESEVVAYRLSQLESTCSSSHLDTDEVVARVEEALGALVLAAGADIAEELVRFGAMLAAGQSAAFEGLRERFLVGAEARPSARDVVHLLFFGEFAAAARAMGSLSNSEAGVRWDPELIAMLAADSPIQTWLDGEFARRTVNDPWSEQRAAHHVVHDIAARLRASSRTTPQGPARGSMIDAIQQWGVQSIPLARGAADHRVAQIASELAVHAREKLIAVRRQISTAAATKFELSVERVVVNVSRIETDLKAFGGVRQ